MQLPQLKISFACHSNLLCGGSPALGIGLRVTVVSALGCWQLSFK